MLDPKCNLKTGIFVLSLLNENIHVQFSAFFETNCQIPLTLPQLEKVLSFFQVFPSFRYRWEPCNVQVVLNLSN